MSFPPHLLDELVFARVALDRLLQESAAREPRHEDARGDSDQEPAAKAADVDEQKKHG